MATDPARLEALRAELRARRLDGFAVPLTDEHLSEYVGSYAQRLQWLTGFEGSAGNAAVLQDAAAIFTDGRYTLQVREQVDGTLFAYEAVPATSAIQWLSERVAAGQRIGYDPWLHTRTWVQAARAALTAKGAELVGVETNPIDAVWAARPAPSPALVTVQPDELAGRGTAEKRAEIADWLTAQKADAAVLSALDSIAWTFNLRGADVSHTPVALAFAIVNADGTADLFVAPEKLDETVRAHLGNAVRVHPREAFAPHLATFAGQRVAADPERATAAIFEALEAGGATVLALRDPAVLPKATKTAAEVAGSRAAHLRDGAAVARFLHWLAGAAPGGGIDELIAQARVQAFREETGELVDLSFDSISGAGPNAAIPHYRASPASNRPLEPDSIYLIDSGGQYRDGTTDITRTVVIGAPTAEMRDRFTRVLKGHMALARAVFPEGTRGGQLDTLARQYLWAAGLDYAHGTGHGVGSFLSVHEGPQRIAPTASGFAGGDEPLKAGMILSNEPGYYKAGHWGIRIENLVLVAPRTADGQEQPLLGFETLTFAPIDRRLIDPALLDASERAWLDDYHAEVRRRIGPLVPDDVRAWLEAETARL